MILNSYCSSRPSYISPERTVDIKIHLNHSYILVAHLLFLYIQIIEGNLFSKIFNGNQHIYSNLIVILRINLRLDVIINTQLLYFYFEKCLSLFMDSDQFSKG